MQNAYLCMENRALFRARPVPESLTLRPREPEERVIFSGGEAIVTQVVSPAEQVFALKWYASLNGEPIETLAKYAASVKEDEAEMRLSGLDEEQVPPTEFVIAHGPVGTPQLYGIQPWVSGIVLKEMKVASVLRNPQLRTSLAELFLECANFSERTGRYPDLMGGDRIQILGKNVPDPRKVFFPFRTRNIMVAEDKAILLDAKTHPERMKKLYEYARAIHHRITIGTAHVLLFLNKLHGEGDQEV